MIPYPIHLCEHALKYAAVLIPSSSGLHFKPIDWFNVTALGKCLNPFFVRSSFQTEPWGNTMRLHGVLIPSSSGLHFKQKQRRKFHPLGKVLIPSSSGLHFKQSRLRRGGAGRSGLNPFFVRSSFQTRARTARTPPA